MALLAAGAGAGIAAAFNAPIAGVLFVVEEMRREAPYNFQGYHAVLIACVAATLVTEAVGGRRPGAAPADDGAATRALSPCSPASACYWVRSAWPSIALVLAALGPVHRLVEAGWMDAWSSPSPPALTTLLFVLPAATGGGEQTDSAAGGAASPAEARSWGLLARRVLVATLASYAAGAPGGIFAPILGLATVAGLAYRRSDRAGLRRAWRWSLRPLPRPPWRRCSRPRCGHPWSASCWWRS